MTLLGSLPILAFLASWILLSNEMNFFRRFQYPVVPIAAMSWPLWISARSASWREALLRGPAYRRVGIAAVAIAVIVSRSRISIADTYRRDGRIGLFRSRHRSTALSRPRLHDGVSEAGLLPFYSQWRTIDAWGSTTSGLPITASSRRPISMRRGLTSSCFEPDAGHGPGHPDPGRRWWSVDHLRSRSLCEPSVVMRLGDGSLTLFYVRRELEDRPAIDAILRRRLQRDQDGARACPTGAVGAS
jgi:hypothetical protein